MTRPATFAHTLQLSEAWLAEIGEQLGHGDSSTAYAALRAVLHSLRDRLPVPEMAQFAAQMPLLLRGVFYEGWSPTRARPPGRSREDFLAEVAVGLRGHDELGAPDNVVRAVLTVVGRHVTAGEVSNVRSSLPEPIRALWPVEVD